MGPDEDKFIQGGTTDEEFQTNLEKAVARLTAECAEEYGVPAESIVANVVAFERLQGLEARFAPVVALAQEFAAEEFFDDLGCLVCGHGGSWGQHDSTCNTLKLRTALADYERWRDG